MLHAASYACSLKTPLSARRWNCNQTIANSDLLSALSKLCEPQDSTLFAEASSLRQLFASASSLHPSALIRQLEVVKNHREVVKNHQK